MKVTSLLIDRKIMGVNFGVELSIGEYLSFAQDIVAKNEYQRKKVSSHGKTYDLLRRDLLDGCVIPPIILAITGAYGAELNDLVKAAIDANDPASYQNQMADFIRRAIEDRQLLILDGLQRTVTLLDIVGTPLPDHEAANFSSHSIRLEIYVGLSKTGILYRMLTLNTGQTPMSFRHQLEILYHDYLDKGSLPDDIEVFREAEDKRARGVGKYKYQDVVDMFYAFSTGSPMPFDRQALVGELREMNFLEKYKYDPQVDEMRSLIIAHNTFVTHLDQISDQWHLKAGSDDAEIEDRQDDDRESKSENEAGVNRPFGRNIPSIFERPQPMAGFGAEAKRLVSLGKIGSVEDIRTLIGRTHFSGDPNEALIQLIQILDEIAAKAKRIGDSQRLYFQYAFRALLLEDSEAFLDLSRCWLQAQESYEMLNSR